MKQRPSAEPVISTANQENSLDFTAHEGLLPCFQEPTTYPSTESN